jgi:hypothetical protein
MTASTQPQPQWRIALDQANPVRKVRANVKRDIAEGRRTAVQVITDPPEHTHGMNVLDVLVAQRQWGRARALRLLVAAQVREGKTLESLTERQRRVLVDLLNWGVS